MKKIIIVLTIAISIIFASSSYSFACTRFDYSVRSCYVLGEKTYLDPVPRYSYQSGYPYSPASTFDILDNYPHYTTEYVLEHFTHGEDFSAGDILDITWMFEEFKPYLTSSPYYSTIFDSSGFKGVIQFVGTNERYDIIRVYPNFSSEYYDFTGRSIGSYNLANEHDDGAYVDEENMIESPYQYDQSQVGIYSCLVQASDDFYFSVACFPGNGYINSNYGFSLSEVAELIESTSVEESTSQAISSNTTSVTITSDPTGFFTDDGYSALTTIFSHVKQFFSIKWPGTNFSILGIFISVIATIFVINVAHNLAGFGYTIAPSKSGYEMYKTGNTRPSKISDSRKGDEK